MVAWACLNTYYDWRSRLGKGNLIKSSKNHQQQKNKSSMSMLFIDAGVEHIHARITTEEGRERDVLILNNDRCATLLSKNGILKEAEGSEIYVTGKLAELVRDTIGRGEIIMPYASLWLAAKMLAGSGSTGIIDLSASGYMAICVDEKGGLKDDFLIVNPKCGAGSGLNLNRILEKLSVRREDVDHILSNFLGEEGKEKRKAVNIRSDRCGVFASSATISDKNQGIPLDYALAVTMKSEVLKACRRMLPKTDTVYLTGRVFTWKYMRDCAEDYLEEVGTKKVIYDREQTLLINGARNLAGSIRFREQEYQIRKREKFNVYPSFQELQKKYEKQGLYKRILHEEVKEPLNISSIPVNMGLDIGSTMAKMVLADAMTGKLLFTCSYENHGDTIATIKHIFGELSGKGIKNLNIQHIGITGSGRYQTQKVLQAVYPEIKDRIFVLVENYAHAHGSLQYAKRHIESIKDANRDFCLLVDIGGEDTKVSVISIKKEELFDNAMNIKCSAGTGSLMDTLKSLFGIKEIREAYQKAYYAQKAYEINATCAVFLMENAKKMQALGYPKDEILASCNHAIVENMSRTLWNQISFPKNAVVLLHGQTMLSEPLPLAVTHRINEENRMYCLVPPMPGHRACIGLVNSVMGKPVKQSEFKLETLQKLEFDRRIVMCRGAACGDPNACCARTLLSTTTPAGKVAVTLGGCTAVNELTKGRTKVVSSSYKDIWVFINSKMPRSKNKNRLVIPRSFAVSEYAYFFAKVFESLGVPVYVDNVCEQDIINAQPLFSIDVCAPIIGAVGQITRLAGEAHGIILAPQIDFLPTNGQSLGKTCTTNQGGMAIAKHYAEAKEPEARIALFDITLNRTEPEFIASQFKLKMDEVFKIYKLKLSEEQLIEAVKWGWKENLKLKKEVAKRAADFLEEAIAKKINVSVVCAREYMLNPGIYDSHIGKLLEDKGIIAIPAYALESLLDNKFSYMYWRNPHDILTKINAVTKKNLHEIIVNKRLASVLKKIETGLTDTLISVTQVSTFRCGPDSITSPTAAEIMKGKPSLYIQSDAMIKELAHLENRVNTHVNQLSKRLHDELKEGSFKIEFLDVFDFKKLNRKTDVVYLPTLHDNKIMTNVFRAAGITTIDNFEDRTYDLVYKTRLGRKYAGDFVCSPLASVYGDILLAAEDFLERKERKDPLVQGKSRVVVFDNKSHGPCRQGQYFEQHKLLLYQKFGTSNQNVKLMAARESHGYNPGFEDWIVILGVQGVVLQGVFHTLLLKAGGDCSNLAEYNSFYHDYLKMKNDVYKMVEKGAKPGKLAEKIADLIDKKSAVLGGVFKYFAYGFYNNNGIRRVLKRFAKKWIRNSDKKKIRIHVEGEVYVRTAQIEEIFNIVAESIGFNSFELTYSPVACYFEWALHSAKHNMQTDIELKQKLLMRAHGNGDAVKLKKEIRKARKIYLLLKAAYKMLRKLAVEPLYRAAGLHPPIDIGSVLARTARLIPTLKPKGELQTYVGEAIAKLEEGYHLILNAAPEGCMVSSMGQLLTPQILRIAGNGKTRIESLFTLNGEVDEEKLRLSLLKQLSPEKYYGI